MKNARSSEKFSRRFANLCVMASAMLLSSQAIAGDSLTVDEPAESVPSANIALTAPVASATSQTAFAPIHREFRRSADGLFYVTAHANGHAVRFVIDTGATVVVLNREDAARLGLGFETLAREARMNTVGGQSTMRWAEISRLEMAGKRLNGLAAAVVDAGLPVSLLGQNALSLLGTVTLRGDVLTID